MKPAFYSAFLRRLTTLLVCWAVAPWGAIYATDAIISVDNSLKIMETEASAETLASFVKAHPAPFWLFGEDRQLSVRNNRIPAHWFAEPNAEDEIRDFDRKGKFSATAQPGEFYVFQVAIVSPKIDDFTFSGDFKLMDAAGRGTSLPAHFISHSPVHAAWSFSEQKDAPSPDALICQPIWLGINVPADAVGKTISGTVTVVNSSGEKEILTVNLPVDGELVKDNGVHDSWRLSRLGWLDSTVGSSEENVPAPYTPVELDKKSLSIKVLGRKLELSSLGLPQQYYSYYSASNTHIVENGQPFWSTAPILTVQQGDKTLAWDAKTQIESPVTFTHLTPCKVCWTAKSRVDNIVLTVDASMECDGVVILNMNLKTADGQPVEAQRVSFDFAIEQKRAQLFMGLNKQGGIFPPSVSWTWNQWNQDSFWFGTVNQGMQIRMKDDSYVRPLINCYYKYRPLVHPNSWGSGGVEIAQADNQAKFSLYAGQTTLSEKAKDFRLDIFLTPFKPINLARHLNDRYYHNGVGNPPEAGIEGVKKEGGNCIILHQNKVQNPYINYPFNDDSIGLLRRAVNSAHERDMRMKVYYTTRELTQNLPEFFALRSLGTEIFMPIKRGVGWPVTNRNGAHPWLVEHVGDDIIPAWHENCRFREFPSRLDLAIITTPDSRWNNFFLAGLDYLVKDVGIDGIYVDDTALDRISMQRARRILDADGNTGRRIDNHSWSHFQDIAGRISSALCYSEIYPYIDSLWYGEAFNYNTPPEYWIAEMSGIPYGLMSQMLQSGGNPWRGMCFAMTQRHGYSGNMIHLWKFFDASDLPNGEFIGFWDAANPAVSSNDSVKVTSYVFKDRIILAVANFSQQKQDAEITISNADKFSGSIDIPEITNFQKSATIQGEKQSGKLKFNLSVDGGRGFLMIVK